MKHRKLRIAWSVACVFACTLLSVQWARSYSFVDWIRGPVTEHWYLVVGSTGGQFRFSRIHDSQWTPPTVQQWECLSLPAGKVYHNSNDRPRFWQFAFARYYMNIPAWFVVSIILVAATPWTYAKHFSLRTLLIATTLVAAALGLIMWTAHL